MKNVLIYINPRKDFDELTKILVKIQVDNMLYFGWKKEDIILVTNFPYEYSGVKAIIAPDNLYYPFDYTLAKITGIVFLFEQGLISDEIYFCHDFDHYQLESIAESEIKRKLGKADMGATDYGRMPRWHLSCIFFKKSAGDIFKLLIETVIKLQDHNEEDTLLMLTENNTNGIKKRVKRLNITYNFWGGNIRSTYPMAEKPIKCVHFSPEYRDRLDFFMYGRNKIGKVLIDERLIKLFNKYGIQ